LSTAPVDNESSKPNETEVRDAESFVKWLEKAPSSGRCVYHRGVGLSLSTDRAHNERVDGLARVALSAAESGRVHLVRHRDPAQPAIFNYIAIKAKAKVVL
jgi:hypothetical protein